MSKKTSDYVFHPPSGSNLPGKEEANPYDFYPPEELRKLLGTEEDEENIKKIKSSLKKWERIYSYPGYPWRAAATKLRIIAQKIAEIVGPAQNIQYYQDMEVPEGYEGILEWDTGQHDQFDEVRENIQRQGERPNVETEFGIGDFLSPKPPQIGVVKPRGDGVDPEGMDNPFPPTGGDIDGYPDML